MNNNCITNKMAVSFMLAFILLLTGCEINLRKNDQIVDQLYKTKENNVTLYVFRFEDKCIETEHFYSIDVPTEQIPTNGAFYKIVADVNFLDGGEAGYMHKPEIRKIHSCQEISINELSFPSIKDERYGLLKLGDYADADYLLRARENVAVYKDGEWIYVYNTGMYGDNNEYICCNEGITKERVYEGIKNGVLCCEDYFVMPVEE